MDDRGFGAAHQFFEREFGFLLGAGIGGECGDGSGKGLRDGFQVHVEVAGYEEKVFAVIAAVEGEPVHGTFSEENFLGGVAGEGHGRDHAVLQAATEGGFGFVEIAAGKICFERRGADRNAVEFDGGSGRVELSERAWGELTA